MSSATIRPVRRSDVPAVVSLVHELATYERAPESCHLTEEQLTAALFGPAPALFGHVAVDDSDTPYGMALWFLNFSTWEGGHGIYLEDLYVSPGHRQTGAGEALIAELARICVERGYHRLEWVMIEWNPAASFFARLGAAPSRNWLPYRLTGSALGRLAERASAARR
ncbi:GNAT family N-acetyltransferase [Actinoplanes sp. N902-109]|uniref:GNAT family N-acetyltransferase n=1 Tax=Actinoplanes sp. (strain N902-109) TaxID=649831 RepID=UPI0003295024|nr:GNAT family N-acetyltransferase [Actinoplanes sp. N902-109]AGL20715.1 GCN5-like N-acetyltransferase [Actinoplanes sp. N902-109]